MNPEQRRARQDRAAAARAAAGRPDPRSGSAPADPDRPELALYRSPRWKITKRSVIARDCGICIVCKHVGDWGKMSADHIESRAEAPDIDFFDHRNLGAVHSWPAACVQCSDLAGQEIFCNQIKSARSLKAARRRILDLTGRDPMAPRVDVHEHVVEDVERVVEDVEEVEEVVVDVPVVRRGRNGAQHPNGKFYKTIQEAQADLDPTVPNYRWLWDNAFNLECPCGGTEGRCWSCLPCAAISPWRERIKAYEAAEDAQAG